ncbi:MAG: molybdenum cofactor biosynthesis protein B [Gammaproteobacteria bacterium]|nr:molybdenum cofactor biosynthesis protein B [Gammaproteobacteria bacterium]MCI0591482.1 molybdenum cofactor biosynthesis protein B [Gammaproteobacteria bacterium]
MSDPSSSANERQFIPLNIAVLTISDTRTEETDKSGMILVSRLRSAGHTLYEKRIVPDDLYQIRAAVAAWCTGTDVQVILTTGGTGVTGRDGTPEAVRPLLDKEISGFAELFRILSYNEIGTSSLQSRAIAGVTNGIYIFCLPGSTGACMTAWDKLIQHQLDYRTRPCNLVELMPSLRGR